MQVTQFYDARQRGIGNSRHTVTDYTETGR
jgi:hypothetical protein